MFVSVGRLSYRLQSCSPCKMSLAFSVFEDKNFSFRLGLWIESQGLGLGLGPEKKLILVSE